jgi:uncharacterized damage-inducible protein DinB
VRINDFHRLYDYSYWANERLFGVIRNLTTDEFTRSVGGTYGSIRNTLVHTLSAEWGWLDRCGGPSRGERLDPLMYPTVQSVLDTWTQVERHMRAFLAGLTDEDLSRDIAFTIGEGPKQVLPLGDLLHHAAVHAAHHRGQVTLLLRSLGHAPIDFDWLLYADEMRRMPAGARASAMPQ